jgi:transcriptional regulator with XRE-family HTH domain
MRKLDIAKGFALVVRKRRLEQGLSQELLAERANLHPNYIGLIERRLRTPSITVAQAVAAALKVPLSKLISEAEEEE